jgi:hypothetical protein
MPTVKCSSNKLDTIENDETLEIVPRRQIKQRTFERRTTSKPKIACPDTIRLLRKQDKATPLVLREGERRLQHRRTSKPTLLNADNIVILRKK